MTTVPVQNNIFISLLNSIITLFCQVLSVMVVSPVATPTKTNPISEFTFIFMAFICPMYSSTFQAIFFTMFTLGRLSESVSYPRMKCLIFNFVTFPVIRTFIFNRIKNTHALFGTAFPSPFNFRWYSFKNLKTLRTGEFNSLSHYTATTVCATLLTTRFISYLYISTVTFKFPKRFRFVDVGKRNSNQFTKSLPCNVFLNSHKTKHAIRGSAQRVLSPATTGFNSFRVPHLI